MQKKIDLSVLQDVWTKHENIICVWVFGSFIKTSINYNDIDIGLYFRKSSDFDQQLELLSEIKEKLKFETIDLVNLNSSGCLLQFEAISGTLLYCSDIHEKAAFVSLVAREYEDSMALISKALHQN